jgi:cytochrome oxidase Cu insertion factor (SCO1/SenC/PrrC family)
MRIFVLITVLVLVATLGLVACAAPKEEALPAATSPTQAPVAPSPPAPAPVPTPTPAQPPDLTLEESEEAKTAGTWRDTELTDVATGRGFKISDFKGKPTLLESFAVWCPTYLRQQKEMKKVLEREGDTILHISLDTDPNEGEAKVKEHLERNGLGWLFAVAPIELTNALIDEFGLTVVSAPSAPVVLICEDQSARFLRNGVKSADDLLSEVEKGCQ